MANWYAKATGLANDNILAMLAADGEAGGAVQSGLLDKEGKPHDLLLIPPRYFERILKARREQPSIFGRVRFFVQHQPGGLVQATPWLGKRRASAVVVRAIADLKQHQEKHHKVRVK